MAADWRNAGSLAEYEYFTTFDAFPPCSIIGDLDYKDRCHYAMTNEGCISQTYFINYIQVLYCGMAPKNATQQALGTFVFILFALLMFLILAITTDHFFCPALRVLSKLLGMNEHLAGITLLAFGNGAPDVFTQLAALNNPSRLIFSDLFGAGIFVSSVVGGTICIFCPFKMLPNNLIRDLSYYLFVAVYIEWIVRTDWHVTILEASGVLTLYFIYIGINFFDVELVKRYIKEIEAGIASGKYRNEAILRKLDDLRDEAHIDQKRGSTADLDAQTKAKFAYNPESSRNEGLFKQLLETLTPYDKEEWDSAGLIIKIYCVLKIPILFILLVLIPVTDYDMKCHGWSKLLNSIQVVLCPLSMLALIIPQINLWNYPLYLWVGLACLPFAFICFFMSRTDIPPGFHGFFAMMCCSGAICVIYATAAEVVNILYVLGIISTFSNAYLGCTILAWGNSIGDMVADVSCSKRGYQKMGFAACYGGPLFNTLTGMGIKFLYKSLVSPTGWVHIREGELGEDCYVFISLILYSTLIWAVSGNFYARTSAGLYCGVLYIFFLTYATLGELQVIETYAPDVPSGLP